MRAQTFKKFDSGKKLPFEIEYEGKKLTGFWESLEWYLENKIECFQSSFCLNNNNKYVWKNFGEKGKGIAIRISKDYFEVSKPKSELHLNLVGAKIFYEKLNNKEGYLNRLSNIIKEILDNLKENHHEILQELCSNIIPWLPSFLPFAYRRQKEYRVYNFYNPSSSSPQIIELENKKGIYPPEEILPEYVKEILLGSECRPDEEKRICSELKEKFPNGEYDHIEINRSQVKL